MSANASRTIARGPVQRKQGVQVLPGWLQSQWQGKAGLLLNAMQIHKSFRGSHAQLFLV